MKERYTGNEKLNLKNHRLGFKPSYEEVFTVPYKLELAIPIFLEGGLSMDWKLIFKSDTELEFVEETSKDIASWKKISVRVIEEKRIYIRSQSQSFVFWDMGSNYELVKLLKIASQKIYDNSTEEVIADLISENLSTKKNEINNLPSPDLQEESGALYSLTYGAIGALVMGWICAFVYHKELYFLFVFLEIFMGLLLGGIISRAAKKSNCINYKRLVGVFVFSVALVFISSKLFEYTIAKGLSNLSIDEWLFFWRDKYLKGFYYMGFPVKGIGLVCFWVVQLYLLTVYGLKLFRHSVLRQISESVPREVLQVIGYYDNNDLTTEEIRDKLKELEWIQKADQNRAFKAFSASVRLSVLERK